MECLFMHAKGSSSGLTLVNATHVFLCEPLLNTAIELQAIARVHRIGQRQATTGKFLDVSLRQDLVGKNVRLTLHACQYGRMLWKIRWNSRCTISQWNVA